MNPFPWPAPRPSSSSAFFWTKVRSAGSCWPLWLPWGATVQPSPGQELAPRNAAMRAKRYQSLKNGGKSMKILEICPTDGGTWGCYSAKMYKRIIREGALLFEDCNHGDETRKKHVRDHQRVLVRARVPPQDSHSFSHADIWGVNGF